jgi:hypothetical protein
MYHQNYNPLGNVALSTIVAAIPIAVLLRSHALGPIFRTVWWHSIAGTAVIGLIALLQAYVFPGMIPIPPGK